MDSVHVFLIDVWLCFLGLFLTFYVLLDGFDLGIGVISLFVRESERRGIMMASLGSVWDANETWLVVLGGALFGAFPLGYGLILNALYLPITVMIFAFVFRGVAFEYREHANKRLWDYAFGIGSLVATLCQGFALGGLIAGPTITGDRFTGGPFDWFSPFSVLVALGVVFGYVLLGASYLIMKTEGEAQRHAMRTAWIAGALMLVAAAGVSLWTPIRYPFIAEKWFGGGIVSGFVIPPLLAVLCSGLLARALVRRQEHGPLIWSIGIFLCSLSGLAASFYPYLIPRSVTAEAAASDSLTLVIMMLGIGLLVPVMIVYNAYQYVVFRGKVSSSHYGG
ncbi:MAG TPA: cytochrome d ubiquinol oxidase subunit II [Stellaceae bacterium]|jgi:cytochrome d ubiquinol oxidase subunit II|nr:cytochrome d ubiquinol oxidase subunit II [Stellaceae bacterium]